jgi:hypothetical protein
MKLKEHKINKEKTFIKGFYIDENICDDLKNIFDQNENIAEQGCVGEINGSVINLKKKKCIEMFFKPGFDEMNPYLIALDRCKIKYIEMFKSLHFTNRFWGIKDNIKIQKYCAPGDGYFTWHFERDGNIESVTRLLVFMTYLNTVKKGGQTEFLYQKMKIKPEKGLTLIWPADWTYTHRGNPVEKEDKYIITGWYNFLENYKYDN